MILPEVTTGMLVVLAIVAVTIGLFIFEPLPIDITALLAMTVLIILGPWTEISLEEGLSGFSNPATLTVLAMLILSEGIRRTGLIQQLIPRVLRFARGSTTRLLTAIIGVAGPTSGFINNTPVVALLVPVVSNIAHQTRTSPSKLLIPLSYAAMLGGMLTVIGTSTNLLASSISERLLDHSLSMFEFTHLGLIVLVVGGLYLLLVAPYLLPDRIHPDESLFEEYELEHYLTEVVIGSNSPLVGHTLDETYQSEELDFDVLQLVRNGKVFREPVGHKTIYANDTLLVRINRETLLRLIHTKGIHLRSDVRVTESDLEETEKQTWQLVELVLPSDSFMVGETVNSSRFRERYDANILAIRRLGQLLHDRLDQIELHGGDVLLVQANEQAIDRLTRNPNFILVGEVGHPEYRSSKIPFAVAIITAVVTLAAFDILPIVVTAILGVIAMVITGVIKAHELYDAVDWRVIFLLAGVIPLGISLEQTGSAQWMGTLVAASANYLPDILVLWIFYIATGLITEIITNNASVVLMIPVAVETAEKVQADPFAFLLAVMFAASTAFMTPIGYQTNLFVYGPGGYRFFDFTRVGAPLQLLLSIVTVMGIYLFWGI